MSVNQPALNSNLMKLGFPEAGPTLLANSTDTSFGWMFRPITLTRAVQLRSGRSRTQQDCVEVTGWLI
jgi:hypothetical protein